MTISNAAEERTVSETFMNERVCDSLSSLKSKKVDRLTRERSQSAITNFESKMDPFSKKTVRFSDVTVREYPMIVGDNPAVSCGPPVTIDWNYSDEKIMSLETHLHINPCPRRKRQMLMPMHLREFILIHTDCDYADIIEATKEATSIRLKRMSTMNTSIMDRIEELAKTMSERIKRFLKRSKRVGAIAAKDSYHI